MIHMLLATSVYRGHIHVMRVESYIWHCPAQAWNGHGETHVALKINRKGHMCAKTRPVSLKD